MEDLLKDSTNLLLLEEIISGNAVSINISSLSRILGKHRNTIRKRVEDLFSHEIVNPPAFPFLGLYRVYPLLAVVRMNILECEDCIDRIERWIKEDPQIFNAFRIIQGEYDTLLFTYHEDITEYQLWMTSMPFFLELQYDVPKRYSHFNTSTSYFSNQLIVKYSPSSGINLMERDIRERGKLTIRGFDLDELDIKIIRCLVSGRGIKVNRLLLCDRTDLHRKTVDRRISLLKEAGLISSPVCRFPNFFTPPNYLLAFVLVELRKLDENVVREMIMDPNISLAVQTIHGNYNLLLFGNYSNVTDQLRWTEKYRKKYPNSFISTDITYLSPEITIPFNHQIVSLSYIRRRIRYPEGRDLKKTIQSLGRVRAEILYDIKHGKKAG